MEIKFIFVYNTENNSFIIKKSNKDSRKYQKLILKDFKNKKYKKRERGQKIDISFGKKLHIYMIKKSKYMIGLLGEKRETKKIIYEFLEEFSKRFKSLGKNIQKIQKDDSIIIWLNEEIKDFENGKKMTIEEKSLQRIRNITENLESQINQAELLNFTLLKVEDETNELREMGQENKNMANEVKNQAWWHNQKTTMFLFGIIMLFLFILGLWLSNLFL